MAGPCRKEGQGGRALQKGGAGWQCLGPKDMPMQEETKCFTLGEAVFTLLPSTSKAAGFLTSMSKFNLTPCWWASENGPDAVTNVNDAWQDSLCADVKNSTIGLTSNFDADVKTSKTARHPM